MKSKPRWILLASLALLSTNCAPSTNPSDVSQVPGGFVAPGLVETATRRSNTPVPTAIRLAATNTPSPTAIPTQRPVLATATETAFQLTYPIITEDNVSQLSEIGRIELPSSAWSMATSPTGTDAAIGLYNGAVALLRLPTSDTQGPTLFRVSETDGDQPVMAIAYSASGRTIAASILAEDQTLIVDSTSGQTYATLPYSSKAIAFAEDESTVYYDHSYQVARRTFHQNELGLPMSFGDGKDGIVCSLAYSTRSHILIVGYCDFRMEGWLDTGNGAPERVFVSDNLRDFECESNSCGWVQFNQIRLSPDGERFLSVIRDDRVGIWDALSGRPVAVLAHEPSTNSQLPGDAAFGSDGRLAYVVAGGTVYTFDAGAGVQLAELTLPDVDLILTVGASADGRFLYIADDTPAIRILAVEPR